jgi:hypothetical protein
MVDWDGREAGLAYLNPNTVVGFLVLCGRLQIFPRSARTIAVWAFDSVARSRFCQAFA